MSDEPTRSLGGQSGPEPTRATSPDSAKPKAYAAPSTAPLPNRLGRYSIVRVLGQGGMGTVYEAQQESPKRTVALKVIRAGYLSSELLRRFGQESQVLGRLQHPGIAQVYEAGTIQDDRGTDLPFFAMEFIKGVTLTEYVNSRKLGTRDRLDLLAKVCDAVYHAHQKGVIHRDLKPGNIMVDESGQPKILDFGVARATDSDIQQTMLQTDIGQLIGTIPYMSPEQVSGDPSDLDTRSDVYALGVIAYELLAGRLPYNLQKKMIHEAARIIKEEEPSRLSSINHTLKGDVETIVAKALEKDKVRRYQSAESLASDIRRYLKHEPITARPASTWYQLQKFSRRNTGLVAGVAAAFVLLIGGLAATLWQAGIAREQRDAAVRAKDAEAEQRRLADTQRNRAVSAEAAARARADELQKVSDFQANMLAQVDPTAAGKLLTEDVTAKFGAALARDGVPEVDRATQTQKFADQWGRVNATDAARDLIDRTILKPAIAAIDREFKDQPVVDAKLRQALAERYAELSLYDAAAPLQERALATRRRELGDDHPDTLYSISVMSRLLADSGKLAEAEPFHREAVERFRRVMGEDHTDTLKAINNMGNLLVAQGKLAEAEPYYREALEKKRRVDGEENPSTLISIKDMGFLLMMEGKLTEAEPYYREALEKTRRVLGEDHRDTLIAINGLATLLGNQGKLAEAEPYFREALEKGRRVLGEEHAETLVWINNLGSLLQFQGKLTEAERYRREALDKGRRVLGEEHPTTLSFLNNLGTLLLAQGKPAEAEPYCREAMEKRLRLLGDQHPDTLMSIAGMGEIRVAERDYSAALALLAPIEGSARAVFTGSNERRLAWMLMNLGKARVGLAKGSADLGAAEANLMEAHLIFVKTRGETHKDTRECVRTLADFYDAWDRAEPGKGYDTKAAEWKARLDAVPPPPASEPRPDGKK